MAQLATMDEGEEVHISNHLPEEVFSFSIPPSKMHVHPLLPELVPAWPRKSLVHSEATSQELQSCSAWHHEGGYSQ